LSAVPAAEEAVDALLGGQVGRNQVPRAVVSLVATERAATAAPGSGPSPARFSPARDRVAGHGGRPPVGSELAAPRVGKQEQCEDDWAVSEALGQVERFVVARAQWLATVQRVASSAVPDPVWSPERANH
jgi:hypothetical protein